MEESLIQDGGELFEKKSKTYRFLLVGIDTSAYIVAEMSQRKVKIYKGRQFCPILLLNKHFTNESR